LSSETFYGIIIYMTIRITIHNDKCKLDNITNSQFFKLYDALSYEDEKSVYYKRKNPHLTFLDTRKRLLSKKRHEFPSGLLPRVLKILSDANVELIDKRPTHDKYLYIMNKKDFPTLYPYQKQALERIKLEKRCAICLPTGSGKTLLAMAAIKEKGLNTLVITPNLNLKEQFLEEAEYYFGKKYVEAYVTDNKKLKGKNNQLKPIIIANIQSIANLKGNEAKKFFGHFHYLACDESHHASASTYYKILTMYTKHITDRLLLTATPFRTDGTDMKLEGVIGDVKYNYTPREAVLGGYIVRPHLYVYPIENRLAISSGDFHKDYEDYIQNNKVRNDKIVGFARKFLDNTEKQILILVQRLEHADMLSKRLPEAIVITGETKENKKKLVDYRLGKSRLIVATVGVLGEGVDLPSIDILIMAYGYTSELLTLQAIGRGVRTNKEKVKKNCVVIDFFDKNIKTLERHSRNRIRTFKEYYFKENIKIIK